MPPYSSLYMDYRNDQVIRLRIGTDDAAKLQKLFRPYLTKDSVLAEAGYAQIDVLLKNASRINPSFRCYEDALEFIVRKREIKEREDYLREFINAKKLPPVRNLKAKLFPYQIEGVLFCALAGRSILADDMGLGKTIQAIALSELMKERFGIQKILIVCPTSLKYQWQSEIKKFTGAQAMVIEGNSLKREALYLNDEVSYKITSYNAASNDWKYINNSRPDLIILDEAQRIKNWRTKVAQSMKKLQSRYALVLTGTPVENNLEELYSLTQFVHPTLLGSLYNFLSKYQVKNKDGKVIGYQNLNTISETLKHVLLRRTKKEVLKQLPQRTDQNIFVTITQKQSEVYDEYADAVARLVRKWKIMGFLREEDRKRLMISLNIMRMVCDSTYIIDQETNHQTKLDELFGILDQVLSMPGEKVVVFSQWERMTRLVAMELDQRKISYQNLNGNVPSKKRKDLLDEFQNNDACRIFLSTDAGGVGLNLQKASYIINLDIPWNPAVLEQRIARIHRLGQQKNVSVINLIARNTIEHRMLEVLRFKSSLAEGILDNGEPNIFIGESKFNKFMQSIEEITKQDSEQEAILAEENEESSSALTIPEIKEEEVWMPQDDDIKADALSSENSGPEQPASELLQTGIKFMRELGNVLSDPNAARQLAQSITEKDPQSGKTYLKIQVDSEAVVHGLMQFLGGLLKK